MSSRPNDSASDENLATLASIFEHHTLETLAEILLTQADNSLDRAIELLLNPPASEVPPPTATSLNRRLSHRARSREQQTRLTQFRPPPFATDSTPAPPSKRFRSELATTPLSPTSSTKMTTTSTHAASLTDLLKWTPEGEGKTRQRSQLIILRRPDDVTRELPCVLVYNFLPALLARDLLTDLLRETPTWHRRKWYLFDRQVTSPHTSVLYAQTQLEQDPEDPGSSGDNGPDNTTMPSNSEGVDQKKASSVATEPQEPHNGGGFYFGGSKVRVRPYLPTMVEARRLIEAKVNCVLAERSRNPLESRDPWQGNKTIANCYNGSAEGVGWHGDRLTYIGPFATIASLSLGVTRQFRIRRFPGVQAQRDPLASPGMSRVFGIDLPHNALLLMLPSMQEEYQHSVPRYTPIDPHPLSGNIRINLTFRYSRPDYSADHTPHCHCGVPCELRAVTKQEATLGRYYYMCETDAVHGQGKLE
ncbi:hypothetical protein H4R33_002057 [Dimargaris cristalligena]|nr:hypothetical protein H4R33_002057 [Dimargaris cristalligena]